MYRILILLVLLIVAVRTTGQSGHRDTLFKLLPTIKNDSIRIMALLEISDTYLNSDPAIARSYILQAGELSRKINNKVTYFRYLLYMANTYMAQGRYDSTLYYHELSLTEAREMKDSLSIGIALFNIGIYYRETSQFEKAISYCLEGKQILEKKGAKDVEMQANDALQSLYFNRTEYDRAVVFGELAVKQARELKLKDYLGQTLINLSMPYTELKRIPEAKKLLEEAIAISKELEAPRFEAVATHNLAGIALRERKYAMLKEYGNKSLLLYRQVGSLDGEAGALRAIAVAYLQEGKYAEAKKHALAALRIDQENKYRKDEAAVLRVLSAIAYAEQERERGFDYDDQSNATLEQMVREVLSERSAELEKKYETEKKESQIRQLEAQRKVQQLELRQKKSMNYVLIGCALTLLVVSLLSYRNYRQKQLLQQRRIAELETEKQLAATEAVLKGEEQERTRLAKDLHDGLGGMLSGIKYSFTTMKGNLIMTPANQQAFERSMDMLDSSIKEMRRVAHNLMPEALVKFGLDTALSDFCNDINQTGALQVNYQSIGVADSGMDETVAITIFRIVQELLNNVLKHASAKTAIVQVTKDEHTVSVTVEDDGNGFDTRILEQSKGIGWINIQSRVDFLKGTLDVQAEPGKGTSVHIELNG